MPSVAALGGNESSVKADLDNFQGHINSSHVAGYTLHEIQTPTGTAVREYVSASGTVFAVGWNGPFRPDLKQLLGAHFSEYEQALQSQNRAPGRGPISIHRPNLVVELSGHMRSFSGRAYLVDQVPASVALESIH